MESKGSLPRSWEPTIFLCPEPDQSNPHPLILPCDLFNIYFNTRVGTCNSGNYLFTTDTK